MGRSTRFVSTGVLLVALGCDAGGAAKPATGHAHDAGHGAGADAAAVDAGSDAALDAVADAAPDTLPDAGSVPPNDSFETALPIDLDVPGRLRDVTRPSEVDYFSFTGEAGAFYALSTDRHTFSPNTIVTLFDPDKHQLGVNDDGSIWPGDTVDSRLVVRLQRSGTYFVRVENNLGADPITPPVYYHLTIKRLTAGTDGVTLQTKPAAAQVHFAQDKVTGYAYATVLGDFAVVHAAAFELEGKAQQLLVGHVLPAGAQASGSTAQVGELRVADPDGHVVGLIDGTKQQATFHPPLTAATYSVSAVLDGDAGKNGFFAIDLVMIPDNPREVSEDGNGVLAGAESVMLKQEMFRRRGLLLSSLPEKDVDYYTFDAPMMGTVVSVGCEGQSGGSGVLGLHAELRDASDKMLAAADETPEMNLAISSFMLPDPGTYYLRLSSKTKATQDAVEPWARCAVIVRP